MSETVNASTTSPNNNTTPPPVPDEASIRKQMEILVKKVDLETITTKQFIKLLASEMGGVDLSTRKKYIKSTLTAVLDAMTSEEEETDDDTEDESEDDEPKQKKRKSEEEKKQKRKRTNTGLTVVKEISDELAAFLGKGKNMARTEVVKSMWAYIKENNLQNPEDKREIILDEKMKALFNVDKFTMFTLNKYVGSHIHPFIPVNLEELSENSKRRKEELARRRKEKKEAKIRGKKKVKKSRKGARHPPYRLSKELQTVVGKEILPRPQVTQALWVYIKANNLQSDEDKRVIVCDDLLRPIMGGNETGKLVTS